MTAAAWGELPLHILGFTRTLRAAGLRVGSGDMLGAVQAARSAGVARREDFQAALSAALVRSPAERRLFDEAFLVHFRNPRLFERMMEALQKGDALAGKDDDQPLKRRLTQALFPDAPAHVRSPDMPADVDAFLTSSDAEVLRHKDFAEMSAQELAQARAILRRSLLLRSTLSTRRYRRGLHGTRINLRATLHEAGRHGGEVVTLVRERAQRRPPPLVLICDISGSMARYTRMFLMYAHTITHARERTATFVFGTRLTNITPQLRTADVDEALARITASVSDWSGGTRIGACLHQFNREWSRRMLARRGDVVLLTDGLEREPTPVLGEEMARLRRTCRRLVWLNPLLRFGEFEARAAGIRAMLPHVHALRSAHDVQSLLDLSVALDAGDVAPSRVKQAGRSVEPSPPRHTPVKGS